MTLMKRLICISLAGLFVLLTLAGCQVIDQSRMPKDNHDRIPWNTKAGWEDQDMGMPY